MSHTPTVTNPTVNEPSYVAACSCGWTAKATTWHHAKGLHVKHVRSVKDKALTAALDLLLPLRERCNVCWDRDAMEAAPEPCATCAACDVIEAAS